MAKGKAKKIPATANEAEKITVAEVKEQPTEISPPKPTPKAPETIKPPYSMKVNRKRGFVQVRVTLHRIPEKLINYEPTATHLYVDTLKYSKKYLLNEPYPDGIKVDLEASPVAELQYGILSQRLAIVGHEPLPPKHFEGKRPQSKAKPSSSAAKQSPKAAGEKRKRTEEVVREQKPVTVENDKPEAKKKKVLVDQKDKTMDIVSQIVNQTTTNVTTKVKELESKTQKVAEIEKKREDRRLKKQEKKQRLVEEAMEKLKKPKKSDKPKQSAAPSKRKVSFE
eukprot:TRINITY_DN8077_c0_g1_i1.p1 TRINITY_DN8077_c0_g1~~TRINITY_DN8077_c0_g1_i1.p1  ORF type:complete len:281 (-),score=93.55 TRINITY_DN8077_c0_g1_i1:62-904(-)